MVNSQFTYPKPLRSFKMSDINATRLPLLCLYLIPYVGDDVNFTLTRER